MLFYFIYVSQLTTIAKNSIRIFKEGVSLDIKDNLYAFRVFLSIFNRVLTNIALRCYHHIFNSSTFKAFVLLLKMSVKNFSDH